MPVATKPTLIEDMASTVLGDAASTSEERLVARAVLRRERGTRPSSRASEAAAHVLKNPKSSLAAKTLAASALTQRPSFQPPRALEPMLRDMTSGRSSVKK